MSEITRRVRIDLLGTMCVYAGDREVVITSVRDRLLLAMLLLHLGQPTPTARLAEAVWGERLPRDARNQVQGCVSRLRRQFTVAGIQRPIISTEAPGYRLVVDPQDVDLYKFRGLRDEARRAASSGRTAEANQHYRDAVALWRGPALADLDSALVRDLSGPLDEERIQAISECIEIEIARGKAGELIPELTELVRRYPYQERLHGALMLAFYRAGRPAEALATYRDVHRRLRDELGVGLGNDLQRLHHAILNRASDLDPPQDEPSLAPTGDIREEFKATKPHMLPPDLPDFVGRENALAQLRELLAGQTDDATSVVVVTGPAGIGKTALSIHAAHMLSDHYRDGQLYVNLRGFDKDAPTDTFEVLGRFLRALGVHGADRLEKLDERVELYRNLLAGRRVLVVLDNAASEEQVAPLIPGGHSCGVIANSRTRLGVAFGAASIGLGVFDTVGGVTLVAKLAGTERTAAEPGATAELVHLGGHLPLAIRIAAGRLVTRPHWSVGQLVGRLRDEHGRLDQLATGQLDVRASIALSYDELSAAGKQLFCRLGDLDLPEASPLTVAALLETTSTVADDVLGQLYDAQVIEVTASGAIGGTRYRLHDLVRLYAKERAKSDQTTGQLESARQRVFSSLLSIVGQVQRRVFGHELTGPSLGWAPEQEAVDPLIDNPVEWFDQERTNIVAAVLRAARDSCSDLCWGLACAATMMFQFRFQYDDITQMLDSARAVSEREHDDLGQAAVLYRTAGICLDLQEYERAENLLETAARLFERAGDRHGPALVSGCLGHIEWRHGRYESALRRYHQALPELRSHHDLGTEALVLRRIGQVFLDQGRFAEAEAHFIQANDAASASGAERSVAQVTFWRGMLRLKGHRFEHAKRLFADVLAVTKRSGDRYGQAQATRGLGLCYRGQGDLKRAEAMLSDALRLFRQPRPGILETQIQRELADLRQNGRPPTTEKWMPFKQLE